jgi:hypothetical protein
MKRACALAVAVAILGTGAAPPPLRLVSYRAVYDVSLDRTSGAVLAARGRLAAEFRDTCDGWSTTQRLITDLTNAEGALNRNDFIVTAWESKDGRTMRFDVNFSTNGKSVERERGAASIGPDGSGTVTLLQGKPAKFPLPRGTQFPTEQVLAVLHAARAGGMSLKHIVFEGGGKTDVNLSTATIGGGLSANALTSDRSADRKGLIRDAASWPVLMSYFPLSTRAEVPDYEVATHLFENGVSGSMSFIYPGYTLRVKLVRLEPLQTSC